jgi:hypothetical protein
MTNDKTENLPATQADREVAPVLDDEMMKMLQEAGSTNDFTAGDLVVPWLSLVQTTGGYMKRNNANYDPNAKEGDITDNLTRRLRSHQAIILCRFETHYTTWGPDGGKLVKQWYQDASGYNAAKFPINKKTGKPMTFGKKVDADGNIVQPVNVYYILAVDLESGVFTPMTLGLASTQFSKAKKVNSLAREMMVVNGKPFIPPIYARIFDVTSCFEQGGESGDKSWAGWVFNPGASVLTHQYGKLWFAAAKQFREEVLAGRVRPQAPEEAGEAAPAPREEDDGGDAETYEGGLRQGGSKPAAGDDIPF